MALLDLIKAASALGRGCRGRCRALCWAAILLCSLPGTTFLLRAAPPSRYAVDVWSTEEGLPQNSVISMVQTRDGYLCLGTLNGLARFDGRHFTVFGESNTPGLDSSKIIKVFQDSRGDLWLGTESGGVLQLEPEGGFRRLDLAAGVAGGRMTAIAQDVAGAVWIYTADGQLGRYRDRRDDGGRPPGL